MTGKHTEAPLPGMNLGDILYVLFRHKWKIGIISILAIVAGLALPKLRPVPYQSEARLFIRYVMETKAPTAESGNDSIRPDLQGISIIDNEVETITSSDLAQKVAETIGADKILGKVKGETNLVQAASVVQKGLSVAVPKNTSVIKLLFKHDDPTVVRDVLAQLIDLYLKKHADTHAVGALDEFLTQETDQLHSRLAQLQDDLRRAKEKAGIISIEDSKKAASDQIAKISLQLLDAEADLEARKAEVSTMSKFLPDNLSTLTNALTGTNAALGTNVAAASSVPAEKNTEYTQVCAVLDTLRKREQDMLVSFTPENKYVQALRDQIATQEKAKSRLEKENPGLLLAKVSQTNSVIADPMTGRRMDLVASMANVTALEAKIKKLTAQLDGSRKEAGTVVNAEGQVAELERQVKLATTQYESFKQSLDRARMEQKLSATKVNIITIQNPSPPARDNLKQRKMMATVIFAGIAAAFALAFLIEFYLDQSLRRAADVEVKLGLPLFLTIPRLSLNGNGRSKAVGGRKMPLLAQRNDSRGTGNEVHGGESNGKALHVEIASWDPRHVLRPFYDALRDRLITFFDIQNLTHKPKLVAVSSCTTGAGVSSVAAGLAASLSETGEGNVLLVDMNIQNGAAHHFRRGDLACGLNEVLEMEKRDNALVQDRLYVASESSNSEALPRALPNRFKSLVPRLRASDYDYIIFDMPPVSQISITPRLAKFMDMVLMVVESEKTDRAVVRRATSMLTETKANVGIVLNKGLNYVPRRLQQEL
jgi:uncharacterized protein involved in exopolysaccharide biosynthesis/Mrp family chromosome partitioning ATPase